MCSSLRATLQSRYESKHPNNLPTQNGSEKVLLLLSSKMSGSRRAKKMTFLIDHILQPDFGSACGSSSSQTLIEEATKNSKNTQLTTEPGHMVGHLRSKANTETKPAAADDDNEKKTDIFIAAGSTKSEIKYYKGEKTEKHSTETGEGVTERTKTEIKTESSTLPAWIFCTRYSDRPSCSGKNETKLFHAKLGSSFVTRIYRAA